ncbi:MAG: zinc-finger domain-containing protein [Bacillaceae bacterium]
MNKEQKKQVITNIHNTVQYYCEGCFVYTQFRKDHSRNVAQHFCNHTCTVGQTLQKLGEQLIQDEG